MSLWISEERRTALVSGASAFAKRFAAIAAAQPVAEAWPDRAMQIATACLISKNDDAAHEAALVLHEGFASMDAAVEDLGKAHAGLASAVVFDAAGRFWSPEELERWRRDVAGLVRGFYEISPGNPHVIGNNWWAVTHSGLFCAVAVLRASGVEVVEGLRPLAEIEAWAWARLDAFFNHFGEGGAYHEGLGYQDYTCSFLLPAALLRESRMGVDLAERFGGLRRMAELLMCSGIEGARLEDETGKRGAWGRQLSWNDAGLGWPVSAVPLMAMRWAPAEKQAALLRQWNRLGGFDRPDGVIAPAWGGCFFQAAFYPEPEAEGGDALPLCVSDRKQGLWIVRDGYRGAADAVLGVYARCAHPGGHSQHDAGSFRFSALGWDWAIGGGQARPEARWQNVATSSDAAEKKPRCGAVLWQEERVFGMDLRAVHGSYSERYVAFHPAGPTAVAVLDVIDDHRTDRIWTWNMTFSPELKWSGLADGFRLDAPDGAAMEVRFLGERPMAMRVEWSPASGRTFANGTKREYISRPCVCVDFARRMPLNIYAVLTVIAAGETASEAASEAALDEGLNVRWEDAVWEHPFGLALPPGVVPGLIRGQCKWPG